jgi:hypothetical protein
MPPHLGPTDPPSLGHHDDLAALVNAIMAEPELKVTSLSVDYTCHSGKSFGYIRLRMGDVGEEQYDLLRTVVNGLGGKVVIRDPRDNDGGVNIAVWAKQQPDS